MLCTVDLLRTGGGEREGYICCHSNQLFCVIIYSSLRSRISSSSSREKTHATISVHLPRATPIAHCHQGEVAIKILMMCHIHRHRQVSYVCVCVTVLLVHLKLRRVVSLMLQLKCSSSSSSSDSRRCSCKCSATLTSPCHAHKLTEFITWLSSSGSSSGTRSSSVVATCNKNVVLLAAKCSKLQQRMQIAPWEVEGERGGTTLSCC